ncbi:hypothetical protein F53441_7591 [Fusarium austroafricanum]|uniref:F-box domain-containing protein n=1 Tax=Fusarium austroafricanum TaxID=2364996 RepID=A0A8H4KH59_9HYPO|nr:hypothetical protein F53441_7591 [Fusarium austroafricanum]
MSTTTLKATSLTDLPREIVNEIFSYFCLHCRGELEPAKGVGTTHQLRRQRPPQQRDQKSWYSLDKHALFSLALSCKTLHPIAENCLYHEFAPGYGDSAISDLYTFKGRLNQFMRTIGSRKDLAEKVSMVFLHRKNSENTDIAQTVVSLQQGASDLGVDLAAAWQRRAEHGLDGITLAWTDHEFYTYFLTKGYQEQYFEPEKEGIRGASLSPFSPLLETVYHELTPILIALLPKLKHLSLENYHSYRLWSNDDPFKALGVEDLPNLLTLETCAESHWLVEKASKLQELNLNCKHTAYLNVDSRIGQNPQCTTLRLVGTGHGRKDLNRALSLTSKSLRSLIYEDAWNHRDEHFNADHIVDILHDHKRTLEILHLDFQGGVWNEYYTESFETAYSPTFTLEGFENLRHVFLSTGILFEVPLYSDLEAEGLEDTNSQSLPLPTVSSHADAISRRLPPSIVSLHLAWDRADIKHIEQGLEGLADAKRVHSGRFPQLRRVGLYYPGNLSEAVHQSMHAAGIDFAYEHWPAYFEITEGEYKRRDYST